MEARANKVRRRSIRKARKQTRDRIRRNVRRKVAELSLIHISEPTRQAEISYAVFCLKKKNSEDRPADAGPDSYFLLKIRRPPRSTQSRSSAASDVYKRQDEGSHPPERAAESGG